METALNIKFDEEQEKISATYKAAEKLIKKAFDDCIECDTELSKLLYNHYFLIGYIDTAWDQTKEGDWSSEKLAKSAIKLMIKDINAQLKDSLERL